ncbi:MAG TPA: right-handed parallel beta-helix repeat-containing protein [Thermoanaerobaculia bacterium]|nr:right-handed parallel beta-helix repeat-containing protein [Thermoanaerobaculia bacterium]
MPVRRALLAAAALLLPLAAAAATYHVAPGGDDGGTGSAADPWRTLQRAADTVGPGDTVIVAAGDYAGFDLRTSGTEAAPIRFLAGPGVAIVDPNPVTPDGINLEGASWVEVAGFTVVGMPREGIRAVTAHHVTIRGNRAFDNGERGILTGFVDDLLIEANETARSIDEHGIYVSNSGDRPTIRGNFTWGNNAAGIHMNGDVSLGGDGIISGALVEGNVIVGNGAAGGSGINGDGVQGSVFRNNLLLGNRAGGITLFQIDGGGPSTGNLVVNNTIVMADDGRWAIQLHHGATGNTLRNNVALSRHPFRGSLDVSDGSHVGLVSDHNALEDRVTTDGGDSVMTLAEWRASFGQDAHSFLATEAELFVDPTLPDALDPQAGDYHLEEGGPAVDAGTPAGAPPTDFEGDPRPVGEGVDVGADEAVPPCAAPATLTLSDDTVLGAETHEACDEIAAGPSYVVAAGGALTLRTRGRVVLTGGFAVEAGGSLAVEIDPVAGAGP